MADKENPFVLAQIEEALEERQTPDRRKGKKDSVPDEQERRQGSRRGKSQSSS